MMGDLRKIFRRLRLVEIQHGINVINVQKATDFFESGAGIGHQVFIFHLLHRGVAEAGCGHESVKKTSFPSH